MLHVNPYCTYMRWLYVLCDQQLPYFEHTNPLMNMAIVFSGDANSFCLPISKKTHRHFFFSSSFLKTELCPHPCPFKHSNRTHILHVNETHTTHPYRSSGKPCPKPTTKSAAYTSRSWAVIPAHYKSIDCSKILSCQRKIRSYLVQHRGSLSNYYHLKKTLWGYV